MKDVTTVVMALLLMALTISAMIEVDNNKEIKSLRLYLDAICIQIEPAGVEDICKDYLTNKGASR